MSLYYEYEYFDLKSYFNKYEIHCHNSGHIVFGFSYQLCVWHHKELNFLRIWADLQI